MIPIVKNVFLLLFSWLVSICSNAQDFQMSVLDLKFGLNTVHSSSDTMIFNYHDQASNPHYFWDTVRPPVSSTLIGGEITAARMSFNRKIYVDGLTMGAYGGHQQVLVSVYTGGGYEHTFFEKFKVIPHALIGWSSLDYYDGSFTPSDGNDYKISGVTLDGESTLRVHNSSWWVAPRLSFAYEVTSFLTISLSAAYRIACISHEKMEFSDGYKGFAFIPIDQSIERHHSYSDQKICNISGMMFHLGFSFYID